MIVRTSKNEYLMIGYIGQDRQRETCLCENTADHRRRIMIRLTDPSLIREAVEFFYEQAENRAFTDFEECAVDGEDLLLIFAYPQGEPLEKKLGGEYTGLPERLAIGKHILERIILQNMPPYFACRCLKREAVWVKRSLDVSFYYDTAGAERGKDFGMAEVQEVFSSLLAWMFAGELGKKTVPPLEGFLRELTEDSFGDYMGLFRRYEEIREELLALPPEALVMPKTWIFRLWDRIRPLFKPLKKILALALLAVALVYMVWTIRLSSEPAASMKLIEQIGTLQIQ